MAYAYVFLPKAQEEYEEALLWYIARSIPAAEGFTAAINSALSLICEFPDRWRNEYEDYYEINVKKYPFSLIYIKDAQRKTVLIASVYHHKRNPSEKYRE